eukprot:EG_transcript_23055
MAFLRQDQPPVDNAVLFDCEGGTHVSRRSTRVTAAPGGNSSISFSDGSHTAAPQRRSQRAPAPAPEPAPPPQQVHAPPPTAPPADPPVGGGGGGGVPGYTALFCSEGDQVRNRPTRRAVQPPGGASSIKF